MRLMRMVLAIMEGGVTRMSLCRFCYDLGMNIDEGLTLTNEEMVEGSLGSYMESG